MKSLAQSLSAEIMVGQLILKLSNPNNRQKVVVWTEGKNWRTYHGFFDSCKIIMSGKGSCQQIEKGHRLLTEKVNDVKSIVVMDADFKRLEGHNMSADPNIFYTDGHDVEMMMIKQDKVQNGICRTFEYDGDNGLFFEEVFEDLLYLSYFKWFDCHHKRCYAYASMGKVNQNLSQLQDLAWIENKLYPESKAKWESSNHETSFVRIKPDDVGDFIAAHRTIDKYEMTNGHDYYNRLCMHIKNKTNYVRNEECLNDTVIALFDYEQFKNTNLYQSLKAWCNNNVDILAKA